MNKDKCDTCQKKANFYVTGKAGQKCHTCWQSTNKQNLGTQEMTEVTC